MYFLWQLFKGWISKNLAPILLVILYLLIFWVRYIQGGWEMEIDLFASSRQFLGQRINQFLPSPQAELLSGIILGNKKQLPAELKLALRDTSTLHIVVVSGQNLSMLAGVFLMLSGLIKRKLAISLSLSLVVFYTLLTGVQVPVLRAALMFSLASLAQIVGREEDGFWILSLTAGLMLLINPSLIQDLSFQLSFLATFGVLIVAPILLKYLRALPIIGQNLAVTLGAQLMVAPVIASNFHQFSLVGLITNVAVIWTIPAIMVLGVAMFLTSFILTPFAVALSFFLNALLTYFIYLVQFFAALPFAWEYVGEMFWIVWVGYYFVVGGILWALSTSRK